MSEWVDLGGGNVRCEHGRTFSIVVGISCIDCLEPSLPADVDEQQECWVDVPSGLPRREPGARYCMEHRNTFGPGRGCARCLHEVGESL